MKIKNPLKILFLLSAFGIGYIVAVLCFKEEVWVDFGSGNVKTTYCIFPCSNERVHSARAFSVFFGRNDVSGDWHLVERRRFVSFSGRESITTGYLLVRAENDLVYVFKRRVKDDSMRKKMKAEFHRRLRHEGLNSVLEYARELRIEDMEKTWRKMQSKGESRRSTEQ